MPNYTFGFEAEYQNNVQELARIMHAAGHVGDDTLHNYTCDCDSCAVTRYDRTIGDNVYDHDDIYNLRIKNDSSCGGELISKVWETPTDSRVRKLWSDIEQAAVNVDSEPGLSAGFHVHVGREHLSLMQRGKLVLAFAAWEDALLNLASGRWPMNRGWNRVLSDELYSTFSDIVHDYNLHDIPPHTYCGKVVSHVRELSDDDAIARIVYRDIARGHQDADRHTSMAFSDRHPTMEFRLWNSTRAAWRMELWCRLSLLIADPSFVNLMLAEWSRNVKADDFVNLIAKHGDIGHTDTFYLAHRQLTYLKNCDSLRITQSTPLTMA